MEIGQEETSRVDPDDVCLLLVRGEFGLRCFCSVPVLLLKSSSDRVSASLEGNLYRRLIDIL